MILTYRVTAKRYFFIANSWLRIFSPRIPVDNVCRLITIRNRLIILRSKSFEIIPISVSIIPYCLIKLYSIIVFCLVGMFLDENGYSSPIKIFKVSTKLSHYPFTRYFGLVSAVPHHWKYKALSLYMFAETKPKSDFQMPFKTKIVYTII